MSSHWLKEEMASSSSKRKRSNEQNVDNLAGIGQLVSRGPKFGKKHSKLARSLLNRYFWGEVSASSVQQLAASALEDGMQHEELMTLARLGTEGVHSGCWVAMPLSFEKHLEYLSSQVSDNLNFES